MKACFNKILVLVAAIIICCSCNKSNDVLPVQQQVVDSIADITSFGVSGIDPTISMAPNAVQIKLAGTVTGADNLVATFTLSPGAKATVNGVQQISGVTKNNFEGDVMYKVTNASGFTKQWTVNATNNDYTLNWGMGGILKSSLSNDRSYTWYFNQSGTGTYSGINCGPSCTAMAAKWCDPTYTGTPQDVRNYYPQNTDLWGLHTIDDYLADQHIARKQLQLGSSDTATKNIIKAQLDQHNIMILLVTTGAIRTYTGLCKDPRCDKFYPESFNHFIVVYGYKEVDNEFYFQVMDPWGESYTNQDGTLKGANRFYRYGDIYTACSALDNFALIVYKK